MTGALLSHSRTFATVISCACQTIRLRPGPENVTPTDRFSFTSSCPTPQLNAASLRGKRQGDILFCFWAHFQEASIRLLNGGRSGLSGQAAGCGIPVRLGAFLGLLPLAHWLLISPRASSALLDHVTALITSARRHKSACYSVAAERKKVSRIGTLRVDCVLLCSRVFGSVALLGRESWNIPRTSPRRSSSHPRTQLIVCILRRRIRGGVIVRLYRQSRRLLVAYKYWFSANLFSLSVRQLHDQLKKVAVGFITDCYCMVAAIFASVRIALVMSPAARNNTGNIGEALGCCATRVLTDIFQTHVTSRLSSRWWHMIAIVDPGFTPSSP